jgi:hypothetical protein
MPRNTWVVKGVVANQSEANQGGLAAGHSCGAVPGPKPLFFQREWKSSRTRAAARSASTEISPGALRHRRASSADGIRAMFKDEVMGLTMRRKDTAKLEEIKIGAGT